MDPRSPQRILRALGFRNRVLSEIRYTRPMSANDPSPLSAADVRRVASLARLSLSDAQVEQYRAQVSGILGYVDRLRELKLEGVEPLTHASDAVNRLDPDEPGPTLPNAVLMAMAPDPMPPFVKVPKVIGEGGGA
jgi:aspartyl-tRNA(Asn)/glutamyl-tRNA(Gln) amidotransferase subunit C